MSVLLVPYGQDENPEVFLMNRDGEVVESKTSVKILGIRFNSHNNMSTHLSAISSAVGLAYKFLQPYLKHAPLGQRKIILTSKVQSIALYGAPLVFNKSECQKKRLENILLRVNKWIYGYSTYKLNYEKMCNSMKVEPPDQKLIKLNTQYISKILFEKEVDQIIKMLKINNRLGSKVYLKHPLKPSTKASLVRHIHLYNALPLDLKLLNPPRLKRKLTKLNVSFKD